LVGELFGAFCSIVGGAPCPDDADGVWIVEISPYIEDNRRIVDFSEQGRVGRI